MFAHERHQAITELLLQRQKLTVPELQDALAVSPATLRRDLSEMESAGKVIRVRGAVVHPAYFRGEPSLEQKSRAAAGAKRAIARAAADVVPAESTVLLDSGSTCLALARVLLERPGVTIFTNSLPVAALAQEQRAPARVICLGGEVRAVSGALVGLTTLDWLKNIRVDWAFVSASGLHEVDGASTTELSEAAVKQQFIERAERPILLADSRKWNKPAAVRFAAWEAFHTWVTDVSDDMGSTVKAQGLNVISVQEENA